MKRQMVLLLTPLCLLFDGCASMKQAALLGAGIGAGAGAGVGLLAPPGRRGQNRARNVIIGSALGGLLGVGAGVLTQSLEENAQKDGYQKGIQDSKRDEDVQPSNGHNPVLIPPRIQSRFVDDQVRGNTFIPAHLEFQITEPARWKN